MLRGAACRFAVPIMSRRYHDMHAVSSHMPGAHTGTCSDVTANYVCLGQHQEKKQKVREPAGTEAEAIKQAIQLADKFIGSKSPPEALRLNKKDELTTARLTKEVVLKHAEKVEMLKDACDNVAHCRLFDRTKPGSA